MFDKERLDPRGVCNLPHVLTIKKEVVRGLRGRVEGAYVLTKFQYFKLKRSRK